MPLVFPYMAMMITGVIHSIFGLIMLILSCSEINKVSSLHIHGYYRDTAIQVANAYVGTCIGCSIWILMNGILGILTGIKRDDIQKTHSLKVGYMVISILSAILFSSAGITLFALFRLVSGRRTAGTVGALCSFGDFVLSIVSASICCCCSSTTSPGATIDGASPESGNYPQGQFPPGNYPQGQFPPGNYPQGQFPPGNYPQGQFPPGNYPPGQFYPGGNQIYPGSMQYVPQGEQVNLAYAGQQNFNAPPDCDRKN